MRPHTEIICVEDLIWHRAELPGSNGSARQQNLSYDEENGAASTRVIFNEDWSRSGGYHDADTEWYVLHGHVALGSDALGPRDYFRAPSGVRVPEIRVARGSEVLIFREFADDGFSASDHNRAERLPRGGSTASDEPGELTVVKDAQRSWVTNIYGTASEGDFQRRLRLKILWHDAATPEHPRSGWLTNLCWALPGMDGTGHGVEHHHVSEEAYGLSGRMEYSFGMFLPGSYFYRPPYIQHFDFRDGGTGHILLMRINGDLINWKTQDLVVEVGGEALGYDPTDPSQAPVLAGFPVRSRSVGPWDGRGR